MHLIHRLTLARSIFPGIISASPASAHLIGRSYGSDNKPQGGGYVPASKRSRELEHPGPPPPNTSEVSQNTGAPVDTDDATSYPNLERQSQRKEPSNKARPTLSDGRESPNVDLQGNVREDLPEDVKQHNRELQQRYDRAYNQIVDGGKVSKGFWKGGGGSLTEDQGGARRNGGH
ncbi:hypothetical protein UA08_01641 [Talaromyces atroroseus]|uniref:Uncharacterized protein n=1 Tax=Talaromyces atroroseus TaxID=1441469 RepID=A0A1Q5QA79_TALAT|nr:hypothetical protein UA08_01641 [Talaromyces atroroseus]OKL62708.1 hypothetical protein UA08_01641 [Talaromyces atroroseus]